MGMHDSLNQRQRRTQACLPQHTDDMPAVVVGTSIVNTVVPTYALASVAPPAIIPLKSGVIWARARIYPTAAVYLSCSFFERFNLLAFFFNTTQFAEKDNLVRDRLTLNRRYLLTSRCFLGPAGYKVLDYRCDTHTQSISSPAPLCRVKQRRGQHDPSMLNCGVRVRHL